MGMQFWRKKRFWLWSAAAVLVLLTGLLASCRSKPAETPHLQVTTRSVYADGTSAGQTTAAQEWETVTVQWTAEQLAAALCQALEEAGLPPQTSELTLKAPDTVLFSGSIHRKLLESYGKARGLSQAGRLALTLLPETVNVQGELGLSWEEGLVLTVRSLSAAGITLDPAWLPEDLSGRLHEKVNTALAERNCRVTQLKIGDNLLEFTCETPKTVVH